MIKLLPVLALLAMVVISGCTTPGGDTADNPDPATGDGLSEAESEEEASGILEDELNTIDDGISDDDLDELLGQ